MSVHRRVLVLVQGDLGRSPRMQYHAYALAVNGATVDLAGLAGVAPLDVVRTHTSITCHTVPDDAGASRAVRAARLTAGFAALLGRMAPPDVVLLQMPPAVPAGLLAWAHARWRRARFVIDWHNLGWTILAMKTQNAGMVAGLRAVEGWLGRRADAHLSVSRALGDHLQRDAGVRAAVVYDRPLAPVSIDAAARQAIRARVCREHRLPDDGVLIVSPTSWTADEDLGLVFEAADRLDAGGATRPVLFLVTGMGVGRAAFDARLASRPAGRVARIATAWIEPGEYAACVASADAGLCLHRSSSGLDLPMKIADMFGAGIPVLAAAYPALAERLQDGDNGRTFTDAASLARVVTGLWSSAEGAAELARLREASAATGRDGWVDGWNREARAAVLDEARA